MLKTYETERLVLKILDSEAAPLVLSFYQENKDVFEPWEPLRSHHFYTLAYHKASLTAEYNHMAEGKLIRFWVFIKNRPEEIIGTLCYQNLLREPYLSCSLGYKFSEKFQHQGYAQESLKKGNEILFEEFQIHRIEAHIMANNKPSLRLIEKLSFQPEGISYSQARVQGVWTDHLRYSMINPKDLLII